MVIVTGGAGFLGSHLVDRLVAEGHRVLVLDNLSTGRRSNLAGSPAELRVVDVAEASTWADLPACTHIFHLASAASPVAYRAEPLATVRANVDGIRHALEHCKNTGARLVFTSTSEVYGSPTVHPQVESYWGHVNPRGPRACYDEAKRLAETLCWVYEEHHNVQVRLARLFNTYGPRMDPNDGRLVPTLLRQAAQGTPLTVHGDGLQTRSLAYVDDTIEGLLRLAKSDVTGPVNLGNPDERAVIDVVRLISTLHGGLTITHLPADIDDPARRCPDIARARQELGWSPSVSLEDGLERLLTVTLA